MSTATVPTNLGPMTPATVVDELTYRSYAFNRQTLSAERLLRLFPETGEAMEQRYQAERGIARVTIDGRLICPECGGAQSLSVDRCIVCDGTGFIGTEDDIDAEDVS